MSYAQTKTYTLNAASTALADIMAALITHWTSAPGLWQLKPAVAATAGEAVVIQAKATPTCDLGIRRVSTTQLAVTVDPDKAIAASGGSATAPTGSANASPECRSGTMSGLSTRLFVVEYTDAVLILFQDAAKSFTPYGIHAGRIYDAARASDVALGLDGHGAMVGSISTSGTNCWSRTSPQTNGARLRVFDSAGNADWAQVEFDVSTNSGSLASISSDGVIKSPRPILIKGNAVNSSNDLVVGFTRWLSSAPIGTSPSFPNANPRNVISSSTDEAWIYLRNSVSATGLIANWERGISPT